MIYNSLCEKEKMRCVFLLRKGGYDISTIEVFLEKVELENLKFVNFLDLYNSDLEYIFNYFRNDCNLNRALEEVNEILVILNSLEKNSQEYYEWMEELRKIVSMILNNIPKDKKMEYTLKKVKDYELSEGWK